MLTALLSISLLFAGQSIADSDPNSDPNSAPNPRLEVEGMTFVASRVNNDAVILHAEHARFDTRAKEAHLSGVDAKIPATSEQRTSHLLCRQA